MERLMILTALLFLGSVYLAVEVVRERWVVEGLELELAEQGRLRAQAERERTAFENALKALDLQDPHFVEGLDVVEVRFPILADPTGGSLRAIPRHGTPVTVLSHRGRVLSYISGQVEPSAVESFVHAPVRTP